MNDSQAALQRDINETARIRAAAKNARHFPHGSYSHQCEMGVLYKAYREDKDWNGNPNPSLEQLWAWVDNRIK